MILEAYQKMKSYRTFALIVFLLGARQGQVAKVASTAVRIPA